MFEYFVKMYQQLKGDLLKVQEEKMSRDYPAVHRDRRLAVIRTWRDAMLGRLERFFTTELPKLQTDAQRSIAVVRKAIYRGLAPGGGSQRPKPATWDNLLNDNQTLYDQLVRVEDRIATLIFSQAIALTYQHLKNLPVLTLLAEVEDFFIAAKERDEFDFRGFSLFRAVIPMLTAMDPGNAELQLVGKQLTEAENLLLARCTPNFEYMGLEHPDIQSLRYFENALRQVAVPDGPASVAPNLGENLAPVEVSLNMWEAALRLYPEEPVTNRVPRQSDSDTALTALWI
jgi:hypothetical protein